MYKLLALYLKIRIESDSIQNSQYLKIVQVTLKLKFFDTSNKILNLLKKISSFEGFSVLKMTPLNALVGSTLLWRKCLATENADV